MFIDTSGFYSFLNENDGFHGDSVTLFHAAPARVTHNYVLDELVSLANARGLPRGTVIGFSLQILASSSVEVIWVSKTMHQAGLRYLEERADKSYSLCDALSFLTMRELKLTEALTTDRHFEQAGFSRLLI